MPSPAQNKIAAVMEHPVFYAAGCLAGVAGLATGLIKDETAVWIIFGAATVGIVQWLRKQKTGS